MFSEALDGKEIGYPDNIYGSDQVKYSISNWLPRAYLMSREPIKVR